MFCVGVTVQRGLACLKAGNGDGGGRVCVGGCSPQGVCARKRTSGAESTTGARLVGDEADERVINLRRVQPEISCSHVRRL